MSININRWFHKLLGHEKRGREMELELSKAASVADRLLALAQKNNNTLTPMQLLKLVYLCHGWMLGLYGRPLIKEGAEAWQYGPVIPDLYSKIKRYRSNPVSYDALNRHHSSFTEHESNIIDQVYDIYGSWSGPSLSTLTHQPDTPWSITWNNSGAGKISNDLIEAHYAALAEEEEISDTAVAS